MTGLKFQGTSSGYGPSGHPSPVTSWQPKHPEEYKSNKAPLDLTDRPPWGANQPRGNGRGNGRDSGKRTTRGTVDPPSPISINAKGKGKGTPQSMAPPSAAQLPKPLSAFIPPPPPTPPPVYTGPTLESIVNNIPSSLPTSDLEGDELVVAYEDKPEMQGPLEEVGVGWRETMDRAKADAEASAAAMEQARAKAAAAIREAEALDLESHEGLSIDGDGHKKDDMKNGASEPTGNKIRRRLELLGVFSKLAVQAVSGERVVDVDKLTSALDLSSDPVLGNCFKSDEVKLGGGLTWEHCLHVLHMQEPPLTDDATLPVSKVASKWFGREKTTVIMDVAIEDRELEIRVTDDTKPEDVAQDFVEHNRIEKRFLAPLTDQIRTTALQVNHEELQHCKAERDQILIELMRVEGVLVDRERRAASLLFNLDGRTGKRTISELSNQIDELRQKLALAQENSTLVANISSSLNDEELLAAMRASHKFRLETVYSFMAPEKLPTVDETLNNFKGHEANLFEIIDEKYGMLDPRNLPFMASKNNNPRNSDNKENGNSKNIDAEFLNADVDGDGQISKQEWRQWTIEKQKIMQEANADRERLMKQNRLLRRALHENPASQLALQKETERAEALHALEAENKALQAEKSV